MFKGIQKKKETVRVVITMSISNAKTERSSISYGYPSLIAYYSFIVNCLLKLNVYNKNCNIKFAYSINSFEYMQKYQKTSTGEYDKKKKKLKSTNTDHLKANFTFKLYFEANLETIPDNFDNKLKQVIYNLRFSSGIIDNDSLKVELLNKDDKFQYKLLPGYIFVPEELDNDINYEEIIKKLFYEKDKEMLINGYLFLTELSNKTMDNKKFRYAEALYTFVNKKVLKKENYNVVPLYEYIQDSEKIEILPIKN